MAVVPLTVALYRSKSYGTPPCWALVADVYAAERGEVVNHYRATSECVRALAQAFRLQLHGGGHGFFQVPQPVDFAVVLMGRTQKIGVHHCGIFYAGKVLHALDSGVLYQDMASLRDAYPLMEFWAK
jgi:hypothetical protein